MVHWTLAFYGEKDFPCDAVNHERDMVSVTCSTMN